MESQTGLPLGEIAKEIQSLLGDYLAVNSETGTSGEKACERFLTKTLAGMPYFAQNPEFFGVWPREGDEAAAGTCYGFVRGEGTETVILLHHYDIVGVEDFHHLKEFAFSPQLLEKELHKLAEELLPEAREDLLSGQYLFGRGTADMKAGGAIQLTLLKHFSEQKGRRGNLLLLALPDEENLSAGMRSAVGLLCQLRDRYGLQYVYAFNSEPHQRRTPQKTLFSEGSVGKMLAFAYARGSLAHCGKVFEGLNPLALLSELAVETELSPAFSDVVEGEASPPPTWLYLRDRKDHYDVSMPLAAGGCVSILTLNSNPQTILAKLVRIAQESFSTVIARMNARYHVFREETGVPTAVLPWSPSVMTYQELVEAAEVAGGERFQISYAAKRAELETLLAAGTIDFIESSFQLTEFVYEALKDLAPRIVLGFVPPYYPNVANPLLADLPAHRRSLAKQLEAQLQSEWGEEGEREFYYTGISDLSYVALKHGSEVEASLSQNMPLYGKAYSIPLLAIESLSMPCMNIGPWGKDFHKLTERVYLPDLYRNTPALLWQAIQIVLQQS